MYNSLEKTGVSFHIYIFAFDDTCLEVLKKLKLKNATIVSLKEFESNELLAVKQDRSRAEYSWTCASSTILYSIKTFKLDNCTYVDADLYFYQSPKVLFDEMGSKSILITEHRYPPKFNRETKSGTYCVQFITFHNNKDGMKALEWWVNSCIDWCYDRYEDGKFGDQKYLDDWLTRFKGVHVLKHLGGGLALWNIEQWPFLKRTDNIVEFLNTEDKSTFEAIFYHYHYVRFYRNNIVDLGWRSLTKAIVKNLYTPYIMELQEIEKYIKTIQVGYNIPLQNFTLNKTGGLKNKLKYLYKKLYRFNIYNSKKLISDYQK